MKLQKMQPHSKSPNIPLMLSSQDLQMLMVSSKSEGKDWTHYTELGVNISLPFFHDSK